MNSALRKTLISLTEKVATILAGFSIVGFAIGYLESFQALGLFGLFLLFTYVAYALKANETPKD